ncbi:MAG TPA: DUF2459 domain-containing protein [Candidatus Binatus sp.]|nr:DUF2459 domain-containing protein [Candidatus Binatus sp.]
MRTLLKAVSTAAKVTCVLMLWFAPGCAAPAAQWKCQDGALSCTTAYVIHDSWHAAIVLSKNDLTEQTIPELADFPTAQMIEFSWGDQDYFPNPNSGFLAAIKAALWSSGSVLHLVGFAGEMETFYHGANIVRLDLSSLAHDRLVEYIAQTFRRPGPDKPAPASAGLFPNSRFYPAARQFSLMRTCNTWVAEALSSAGLPLSPRLVITAGNLSSEIAAISEAR